MLSHKSIEPASPNREATLAHTRAGMLSIHIMKLRPALAVICALTAAVAACGIADCRRPARAYESFTGRRRERHRAVYHFVVAGERPERNPRV